MENKGLEPKVTPIIETENYGIYRVEEPDETTYNLQLNNVTVNFFKEEWEEFLDLVRGLMKETRQ